MTATIRNMGNTNSSFLFFPGGGGGLSSGGDTAYADSAEFCYRFMEQFMPFPRGVFRFCMRAMFAVITAAQP